MSWIILEEINFLWIKNRSIIEFCLLDSLCLLIYDMSWIIWHIHYFIIQVCSCWSLECVELEHRCWINLMISTIFVLVWIHIVSVLVQLHISIELVIKLLSLHYYIWIILFYCCSLIDRSLICCLSRKSSIILWLEVLYNLLSCYYCLVYEHLSLSISSTYCLILYWSFHILHCSISIYLRVDLLVLFQEACLLWIKTHTIIIGWLILLYYILYLLCLYILYLWWKILYLIPCSSSLCYLTCCLICSSKFWFINCSFSSLVYCKILFNIILVECLCVIWSSIF